MFEFIGKLFGKKHEAYCVKCKTHREISNVTFATDKGRKSRRGSCSECGSTTSTYVTA